jgi:hypothetical protein
MKLAPHIEAMLQKTEHYAKTHPEESVFKSATEIRQELERCSQLHSCITCSHAGFHTGLGKRVQRKAPGGNGVETPAIWIEMRACGRFMPADEIPPINAIHFCSLAEAARL